MKNLYVFLIISILSIVSCEKEMATPPLPNCDENTEINADEYQNAMTEGVEIMKVEIVDQCLNITYSASGCSGDSWKVSLIDSGDILESMPPQRNLKFSLENQEVCLAFITKTTSFDISNLQIEGNSVVLNINDSDENILFEY
ncbi:hypothetical protein [Portibacter lacus]|uniref:Uncharacterized protein n=1 Tax=Portibacter lacus TaxID=1099794 RepID=A0AA37WE00_9BACT|nr:hypothetical protein [Portibacter lacus]GLR15615.1 hypothetical protein GCM10007940_02300 [Portibacter lacus]